MQLKTGNYAHDFFGGGLPCLVCLRLKAVQSTCSDLLHRLTSRLHGCCAGQRSQPHSNVLRGRPTQVKEIGAADIRHRPSSWGGPFTRGTRMSKCWAKVAWHQLPRFSGPPHQAHKRRHLECTSNFFQQSSRTTRSGLYEDEAAIYHLIMMEKGHRCSTSVLQLCRPKIRSL